MSISIFGVAGGERKDKLDASVAPVGTNDGTEGYSVGSHWVDIVGTAVYVCVDTTTGAAVWNQVDAAAGATAFTGLSDAPASLTAYNLLRTNSAGTALESHGEASLAATILGDSAGANITTGVDSVLIGELAGNAITTSNYNVLIGKGAGQNVDNTGNTAIGTDALNLATTTDSSVVIGAYAGSTGNIGSNNTIIGHSAGKALTGDANVMIGKSVATIATTAIDNTIVGALAGTALTTGDSNVFIGNEAGLVATTSNRNIFIGDLAGAALTTGGFNTFVGNNAGRATILSLGNSTFIGNQAGYAVQGIGNTLIGYRAGGNTTANTFTRCTYVGFDAGRTSDSAADNVALGYNCLDAITTGSGNVTIGSGAGGALTTGSNNTLIGDDAGAALTTTGGNVCIGSQVKATGTFTNQLHIHNSDTADPLIYGEFDNGILKINGSLTVTGQADFPTLTLTDGANIAWNANDGSIAKVTLAGNRTLDNPTNLKDGATYALRVIQDATGSRTLAYGSAFKWPGGTAPTLTTTANAIDILTFLSDGTNLYGVSNLAFS